MSENIGIYEVLAVDKFLDKHKKPEIFAQILKNTKIMQVVLV